MQITRAPLTRGFFDLLESFCTKAWAVIFSPTTATPNTAQAQKSIAYALRQTQSVKFVIARGRTYMGGGRCAADIVS